MHWPPKQEDRGDWSAVAGVFTLAMVAVAVASPLWPIFTGLAVVGFYACLAPLSHLWPWRQHQEPSPPTGITAGHGIKAGGDIESPAGIQAGQGIEAGGDIRTVARPDGPRAAIASQPRSDLETLGPVNPLVGHFKIRQYAAPLAHDDKGTVFRVVVAAASKPAVSELDSAIKAAFKDALSRSSLERWGNHNVANQTGKTDWLRAQPSLGTVATFERDWGLSTTDGSVLSGKATLQLPPGHQFGSRAVLALDAIERSADAADNQPRLTLSLADLHAFLHLLGNAAVHEIASVIFPLICAEGKSAIVGPNYEISFGDRSLDTAVNLPSSFDRPANAVSNPWAEINTPESSDPRDLTARDVVIRSGLEKVLRSNEYDEIEDEIAKLALPPDLHSEPTPTLNTEDLFGSVFGTRRGAP
jgi:hypothetical protein